MPDHHGNVAVLKADLKPFVLACISEASRDELRPGDSPRDSVAGGGSPVTRDDALEHGGQVWGRALSHHRDIDLSPLKRSVLLQSNNHSSGTSSPLPAPRRAGKSVETSQKILASTPSNAIGPPRQARWPPLNQPAMARLRRRARVVGGESSVRRGRVEQAGGKPSARGLRPPSSAPKPPPDSDRPAI